jgi:hypothetical protein
LAVSLAYPRWEEGGNFLVQNGFYLHAFPCVEERGVGGRHHVGAPISLQKFLRFAAKQSKTKHLLHAYRFWEEKNKNIFIFSLQMKLNKRRQIFSLCFGS